MKDLLFLSNGHGEDEIASRVLDEVVAASNGKLAIDVWPMVGEGSAYRRCGMQIVGSPNTLPSEGFETINAKLMIRDLRVGWIATHLRQIQSARALTGSYRLAVAIGDVVPMIAATLARTPFVFIGCAKSSYSRRRHCYSKSEMLLLLRRGCKAVYPRDRLTADELSGSGLPIRFAGNPMMDGLEGSGDRFGIEADAQTIVMLSGSRQDAGINTLDLLNIAAALAEIQTRASKLRFVFAAPPNLDVGAVSAQLGQTSAPSHWHVEENASDDAAGGVMLRLQSPTGARALVIKGRLADVLRLGSVVVGMAGTANEQAIGLGIPLVVVPSSGIQGKKFARSKMRYFGPAAILADEKPANVATTIKSVLDDPARQRNMIKAGQERMGGPGASAAIAHDVLEMLAIWSPQSSSE